MITLKSPQTRSSAKRIISRTESPLTSRKPGSPAISAAASPYPSGRNGFSASSDRNELLPPLDIEGLHSGGPVAPILIVDDEPFVADLLFHWVNNVWDYPAIIARDGESAIVAMREHHPRM